MSTPYTVPWARPRQDLATILVAAMYGAPLEITVAHRPDTLRAALGWKDK